MRILTRKQFQDDMAKMWSEAVEAEYKAQIEAAVLAEREACVKVCEELEDDGGEWDIQQQCANAIQARGQA
jgi:stalled ribosome rescue protein Dom34